MINSDSYSSRRKFVTRSAFCCSFTFSSSVVIRNFSAEIRFGCTCSYTLSALGTLRWRCAFVLHFSCNFVLNSTKDSVNSKYCHKSSNAFNCFLIKSSLNCSSSFSFFNFLSDFASKLFNAAITLSLEMNEREGQMVLVFGKIEYTN